MKINKALKKTIAHAAVIIKKGGVVVYPTDTAYALGADPWRVSAIQKIYKIKGRAKNKPLPMIAASRSMVLNFFRANNIERALMKKYWPGPLSIILETRKQESTETRKQHSHILKNVRMLEVAVRVPKNKVARELARRLGRPIISTSANLSGRPNCYSAAEIYKQFKNRRHQPDLILDAGKLPKRKPSTIIKINKNKIFVLRKGSIKNLY